MMISRPAGRAALAAGALALSLLAGTARAAVTALPSLAEPALSPDGSEIAFASGGDIWTVPAQGGQARLLVTDPATESRPVYSPDGTRLAFVSTRSGAADIYVLTFATGQLKRMTWSDAPQMLDGWSRDGKWLYFSSPVNDIKGQNDIFRVSAEGGTPLEVSRERYLNEFESAPSPDGRSIALMARGLSNSQWWRNGHSHIDETELWLKPIGEAGGYRRLLAADAKHAWPMWSPDGGALYFMSDASGAENIWRLPLGGAPEQLTRFTDGRVLWPSIGADGRAIVFERGFAVWKLDLASGQAAQVPIALRGAPASAGQKHLNETSFGELALAPDGKKIALTAHGEVFAASAKDGGAAQRVSHTDAAESELDWAPDSRSLVYVSERGLDTHLVRYDFDKAAEQVLTADKGLDASPAVSPDGRMIAYVHGAHDLRVLTLAAGGRPAKDTLIFTGALGGDRPTLAWSPDSRWLAFVVVDRKSFRNVNVIPAAGGTARPISFLANGQTGGRIAWSPDGKFVLFDTAQRSEDAKIVRVDLLPHVPKYREDAFRDLFKPGQTPDKPATPTTAPAAPTREDSAGGDDKSADAKAGKDAGSAKAKNPLAEPVRIVFDGIRERATLLPLGMDAEAPVISPDGKTLVYRTDQEEQQSLYAYSLDELAKEPPSPVQLTTSRKAKTGVRFTPDSKEIYYLDGGAVFTTPVDQPKPKAVAASAEMDVDFDTEKMVVFDEAWRALDRGFFDANFNGHDWAGLRAKWEPYVAGVHTGDELRRDINLMIGELNASHSGIGKSADAPDMIKPTPVGALGLRFDRAAYEAGHGLKITEVVALGPAAIEGSIVPGETLVSVDHRPIGPDVDLDSLLTGEAGKKVVLGIASAKGVREAVVRPVPTSAEAGLLYRQWVNDRRAYVEKISGGRLGYVHIPDMTGPSLEQLYIDLDAQNQDRQGVVIDLRNNNGGFINGYALDVFSRRNFMTMTPRNLFAVPSRQALGQRALGLPTVLVTNESSLSDAEDFTEGYRALGLGRVVGQPTAGWIIYTSPQRLIDGSAVRIPGVRITDARGGDMEMHPRPVDVAVERPLGETGTGHDAQLEAAVAELLKGTP